MYEPATERALAGYPVKTWSMKDLKSSRVIFFGKDLFGGGSAGNDAWQ